MFRYLITFLRENDIKRTKVVTKSFSQDVLLSEVFAYADSDEPHPYFGKWLINKVEKINQISREDYLQILDQWQHLEETFYDNQRGNYRWGQFFLNEMMRRKLLINSDPMVYHQSNQQVADILIQQRYVQE